MAFCQLDHPDTKFIKSVLVPDFIPNLAQAACPGPQTAVPETANRLLPTVFHITRPDLPPSFPAVSDVSSVQFPTQSLPCRCHIAVEPLRIQVVLPTIQLQAPPRLRRNFLSRFCSVITYTQRLPGGFQALDLFFSSDSQTTASRSVHF